MCPLVSGVGRSTGAILHNLPAYSISYSIIHHKTEGEDCLRKPRNTEDTIVYTQTNDFYLLRLIFHRLFLSMSPVLIIIWWPAATLKPLLCRRIKRFPLHNTCSPLSWMAKRPGSNSISLSISYSRGQRKTAGCQAESRLSWAIKWYVPRVVATAAICCVPAATVCSLFYHSHLNEPHSQLEKGDLTANQPPEKERERETVGVYLCCKTAILSGRSSCVWLYAGLYNLSLDWFQKIHSKRKEDSTTHFSCQPSAPLFYPA